MAGRGDYTYRHYSITCTDSTAHSSDVQMTLIETERFITHQSKLDNFMLHSTQTTHWHSSELMNDLIY